MTIQEDKKPKITDSLPRELKPQLIKLQARLDKQVPPRVLDRNLLIATWNIRAFGRFTEKWVSEEGDSPKRDLFSMRCIAEIISRFDVVAVQEVKGNLKALRHLMKALGKDWGFLLTDITQGDKGNGERLAFIYDKRRVGPSGLAGEIVMPETSQSVGAGLRARPLSQFARTPYAVSFTDGTQTFILVTMHVIYGDRLSERAEELKAIAEWLADWARSANAFHHNLILLGDFNIDRKGDRRYDAFTSTGLYVPAALHDVPRTVSDVLNLSSSSRGLKPTATMSASAGPSASQALAGCEMDDGPEKTHKFYDQIAWFHDQEDVPCLSLSCKNAGGFNFARAGFRGISENDLSWKMSDHLPLWVEFSL